ncbi:DUF4097 family beta strand repeat-containing protein [Bdellovibrio sp. HCB-110]|uniref:DUF4097 family beta strand repeat-containing protein n=1 Tax=Bdellovibrio sp. HCB-110 TaxID=3391182 RepID=UPI0039B3D01F
MSAISFILAHLLFNPVMAATYEVPVAEGDRLVLKGLEAHLQISGQVGGQSVGNSLKVSGVEESGTEGVFVVTKKDNIIEVKMNEYSGKRSWLNILPKASSQMKKIEIWGPSIPTEIQLRGGSVVAQKWSKDLKVSLTQGRVNSLSGAGSLQVYVQKGDVNIQDHTGKVEADSYNGSMALKNIQGDVDASLFAGQLNIEKVRGFLSLSTQQSNSKVNMSSGTIQFENGKGSLNIQTFQGRMEGQNQEGAVTIAMALDSEVDVKTKSGKVSVQAPPSSGASLNLLTTEGEILVPSEIKVTKLSAEKSVRARLRGDAQRGSIFVRSQDGTISVK